MIQTRKGNRKATGLRFGIIVSEWNPFVTDRLLEGAIDTLKEHDVTQDHIEVVRVPGSFEIPLAAKAMAERNVFDALICLGAVIRGETTHHIHIGAEVSAGINRVSLDHNLPIGFGILTTENRDQAIDRSEGRSGKGVEAALAAIEMATLLRDIKEAR